MSLRCGMLGPRPAALVTVDVEPDDTWANFGSRGLANVGRLPAFHAICADAGMRPTYFATYSVVSDGRSAAVLEGLLATGGCEIGAHPHMWEIPPHCGLDDGPTPANRYDAEIFGAKLGSITELFRSRFGAPLVHRAGRWGFAAEHAEVLAALGYAADSSVTPGIDWRRVGAPDFRGQPAAPHWLAGGRVYEVPCTVRPARLDRLGRWAQPVLNRLGLGLGWLRCTPRNSTRELLAVSDWAARCVGVLNLMTHSSELAAGTSPFWRTQRDADGHLARYGALFDGWRAMGVRGCTLGELACEARAGAQVPADAPVRA